MSNDAAADELERAITAALASVDTLPDAAVERVHSWGFVEDDETTFAVYVDLEDGTTAVVSIIPGRPISVQVVS